jgi:excisionase family DNA binding protein
VRHLDSNSQSSTANKEIEVDTDNTIVLTIAEACAAARIGRTSLYREVKAGKLRAIKRGRRTLILLTDLRRWLQSSPAIKPTS